MKIIFIVHSIQVQRCIKRIEDFIKHGFDVDVYGFDRKIEIHSVSKLYSIEIIGVFDNSDSYISRSLMMFKAIRKIKSKYKEKDVLFYFFGFDTAILGTNFSLSKKNYFFEESDLIHTKINNSLLCRFLEYIDKRMILRSFETIFTSEGFEYYHFKEKKYPNISLIPNRVNKRILDYDKINKQPIKINNLKIGLVGGARYRSAIEFATIIGEKYPQHEFHFFGYITGYKDEFERLKRYSNIYFHGVYANPDELYKVYSQVDLVIATYDATSINVRYAEPNKLYDSIYFETPIIVSSGTYLSKKVEKLGIGYSINALDSNEVISFLENITEVSIQTKIDAIKVIPKEFSLDINTIFFNKLRLRLDNE